MTSKLDDYTPILKDTGDDHVNVYLRPETAIKLARRLRKVAYFIPVGGFTYTTVPGDEGQGGKGYDLGTNLRVSAAQFIEVLENKKRFEGLKKEEHFIRITRLGHCIFMN